MVEKKIYREELFFPRTQFPPFGMNMKDEVCDWNFLGQPVASVGMQSVSGGQLQVSPGRLSFPCVAFIYFKYKVNILLGNFKKYTFRAE